MNSTKFVERLQEARTGPEDLLVSFDVTSLFTQVPLDEALEVVKARLNKDPTLMNKTSIPVPQVVELIELCLRSSFKVTSLNMGSPLSLIIAKLFMEDLEEQALHSAPLQPSLWLRYVEDIFVIWPYGEWDMLSFHTHLNQMSANIQFTIEKEEGGRLAFLDVLLTCSKDQLSTAVYRKPTHTDTYILYLLTTIQEC